MSEHLSTRGRALVTRRRALAAVLRGCGGVVLLPWLSSCSDEPERPDPVELLVRRSADRERRLLARYEITSERHPGLAGRLAANRADHQSHLEALVGTKATPSARQTGKAGQQTGGRRRQESRPLVPASPDEALAALVRAEQRAASEVVADLATAPPRLRRLLASVGGAEASHAALLAGGEFR